MNKVRIIYALALLSLSCNNNRPAFDKIIFHTSICFGTCPAYHLELDSHRRIKLFAESVPDEKLPMWHDTTKMGYFTGIADENKFDQLSHIIQTIGVEKLKFNGINCCDGSMIRIIIYRNGKKTMLASMFPPEKAGPLISVLYQICGTSNLKRSTKPFNIEKTYDVRVQDVRFPPGSEPN
jgi:hypothetical protein